MRKITISLPSYLVAFADQQAQASAYNRSQVIEAALHAMKNQGQMHLAAEGYQFYAQEASEFTEASSKAVAIALDNECSW